MQKKNKVRACTKWVLNFVYTKEESSWCRWGQCWCRCFNPFLTFDILVRHSREGPYAKCPVSTAREVSITPSLDLKKTPVGSWNVFNDGSIHFLLWVWLECCDFYGFWILDQDLIIACTRPFVTLQCCLNLYFDEMMRKWLLFLTTDHFLLRLGGDRCDWLFRFEQLNHSVFAVLANPCTRCYARSSKYLYYLFTTSILLPVRCA